MLVKILRDTVADRKPVKASDEPIEISDADARILISTGKAVEFKDEAPAAPPQQTPPAPPAPKAHAAESQEEEKAKDDLTNEEGDSIEDALDKDPDLGPQQDGDAEDPLPEDYQELVALAVELGIDQPAKIKKVKLKEAIIAKRAESKAAA